MKILHTSDLHGKLRSKMLRQDFDMWIDTGDSLPNQSKNRNYQEDKESKFQYNWMMRKIDHIISSLNGRPLISVSGNHCYINLAMILRSYGYSNAYTINLGEITEINGLKFSGFPHINWIDGKWMHEVHKEDINKIVDQCPLNKIDVLLTHAPPYQVLDLYEDNLSNYKERCGIIPLSNRLMYEVHSVKYHFFGHIHDCGGLTEEHNGIIFHNGATKKIIHEI